MEVSIKSCDFQEHSVVRDMVMGLNFIKQSRKKYVYVCLNLCVCVCMCVLYYNIQNNNLGMDGKSLNVRTLQH